MRERDEAQAMLINQKPMSKQTDHSTPMEIQDSQPTSSTIPVAGLSSKILNDIVDKSKELSAGRKGRKVSTSLASKENISSYNCKEQYNPHSGEVTCIAVPSSVNYPITHVVTGGSDKKIIISDNTNGKPVVALTGHTKKVTHVSVHGIDMKRICSAAADQTIRIWDAQSGDISNGYTNSHTLSAHNSDISSISLSPTGNYLLSTANDWCLHDIVLGQTVYTNSSDSGGYTCCGLHPDGLVFGTGTSANSIKIWDIRDGSKNVAECSEHISPSTNLTFSENGYILASGANDGQVKLWDLRKMKCIQTLDSNLTVTSMVFDYSGTYLAVARREALMIYMGKEWTCIKNENVSKKIVSGVAWNADAMGYWAVSTDKTVKYYAM
jgi:pre-mRNA-processing factor 19